MSDKDWGPIGFGPHISIRETNEFDPRREHAPVAMSLRDHFAGLAMQGLMAGEGFSSFATAIKGKDRDEITTFAHLAYAFADAMLESRENSND